MLTLSTLKFKIGIYCFFLIITGFVLHAEAESKPGSNELLLTKPASDAAITSTASTSLTNNTQTKPTIGEKIVAIARAEKNRGPDIVGSGLASYPNQLSRYLKPNEAWCSEFVSWAYKTADSPFTDGYEGGWMIKDSVPMKEWFKKHKRFITPADPDWSTFVPQPGDYIRYNLSTGGHSGIVNYVAGDFLYTVEGNVSNQVREKTIFDWRHCKEIDGFGLREVQPEQQKNIN